MNEMVERVAKAMWDARRSFAANAGIFLEFWGDGTIPKANGIMEEARGAIGALREPTEAMVASGEFQDSGYDTWKAMIDAILNEPAKEPEDQSSQTYGDHDNYALEFEPTVITRARHNADAPYDQRTCRNYPWAAAARIRVLEAELRIARDAAKLQLWCALDAVGLKIVEK